VEGSKVTSEIFKDQIQRVECMSNPRGTWDLSDNDMAALSALLDHYRGALEQLAAAKATIAELQAEALRFYRADGSYETLASAEDVQQRRIDCAKQIERLSAELNRGMDDSRIAARKAAQ
jgi:hypothetical protein